MANTNVITIAELEEIQSAPDTSFIPIDDGSVTNKISIENFTASSNQTAEAQALKSEGYAVGKQDGTAVEEGSPYYQNNAKYYSDQASTTKTTVEGYIELAQTAQETATQKASDASSAADQAEAFADDARRYAQAADGHAIDASGYATTASSSATIATNAKNSAISAASDAQSAKLDAISAKNTAVSAKDDAETAATSSHVEALKSEGYALGKQNGAAVTSGSPYYNNNAFYFYRQALSKANLAEYQAQVSEGYAKGTMGGSPCHHDQPGYNDNSKYYKDLAATSASSAASSASQAEAWSSNPPYIGANGNWYVYDIETSDYADSGIDASISVTVGTTSTLAPGSSATVTNSGTDTSPVLNFGIPQGAKGDIGITPDITVSATADATSSATPTVNVTKGGTTTAPSFALAFSGLKGTKGDPGNTGDDGVSPEVTISAITDGHTVTITDADHPSGQSFNVMDGEDGDDGVSPAVSTSIITGGHTVTITDKDHPSGQSFNVMDGQNGQDGDDGVSPEVTITTISGGHTVTITDADHPSGQSFNIMDGAGAGDMLASTYDPTSAVATAGGIPAYVSTQIPSVSGKADKVTGATNGNFAGLDSNGNLTDSGSKASDFAASSHTHTKSQITDFPSLGTASAKDVPASGNASSTQVVMGDDTRLSDARTPVSHTHTKSEITDFPSLATVATSGSYNDLSNKPTIPDTSSFMTKANPTGTGSLAVGNTVSATGTNSVAVGYGTKATGMYGFAEGRNTTASAQYCSHASGWGATASHNYSFINGNSLYSSFNCEFAHGGEQNNFSYVPPGENGAVADKATITLNRSGYGMSGIAGRSVNFIADTILGATYLLIGYSGTYASNNGVLMAILSVGGYSNDLMKYVEIQKTITDPFTFTATSRNAFTLAFNTAFAFVLIKIL